MLNTLIACKHLQPNQLHDETEVRGSLFGQTADGSKFCVSSHICIILAVANSLVTMVEFLNFWYIPRKISICAPVFASTGGGGKKVSSTSHPSLPGPELAIINPRAWIMDVNESLTGRMRLQKSTGPIRWGEDVSLGTKMGFCQPLCLSHSAVRRIIFHIHTQEWRTESGSGERQQHQPGQGWDDRTHSTEYWFYLLFLPIHTH